MRRPGPTVGLRPPPGPERRLPSRLDCQAVSPCLTRCMRANRHGTTVFGLARLYVTGNHRRRHGLTERAPSIVDKRRPKFNQIRLRFEDGFNSQNDKLLLNKEKYSKLI